MKKSLPILFILFLVIAFFYGYHSDINRKSDGEMVIGSNPELPTLVLYTSAAVTTPQIPFWAALKDGKFSNLFNCEVRLWQNIDEVQNVMLAGVGDLWIAHTEGFAMARHQGAPVTLLAVSGWKKFYIVTTNAAYSGIDDLSGTTVAYAPPGSPGYTLFNRIAGPLTSDIRLQPYQGRELQMLLMDGKVTTAILPEPLVSMMLLKNASLQIAESLEELYGKQTGREPRLPLAGIAMNEETAREYPHIARAIQDAMITAAKELQSDVAASAAVLPERFSAYIPQEVVRESLKRDIIMVHRGSELAEELAAYMTLAAPHLVDDDGHLILEDGFLWSE